MKKNRKKEKDEQKRKEERVNLYKDIRNGDAYSNPKDNPYAQQTESAPPKFPDGVNPKIISSLKYQKLDYHHVNEWKIMSNHYYVISLKL